MKGQVAGSAAEVYDQFFLPALFDQWTSRVADAAGLRNGDDVLDVACGTGALSLEAARRVEPDGQVTGLDVNEGMLAVARRKAPELTWRTGRAEDLPFDDGEFDAVVSQFGLMFFDDRGGAVEEMARVLKPGGRLAIAVWADIARSPGYTDLSGLLRRLFGEAAAAENAAPYALGDIATLRGLVEGAGFSDVVVAALPGRARFPSLESWLHTEVKGWTLADMIDDDQYAQLVDEAPAALGHHVTADGSVVFDAPANIATAKAPTP